MNLKANYSIYIIIFKIKGKKNNFNLFFPFKIFNKNNLFSN